MTKRIISIGSRNNVYHKDGCPHADRISPKHKKWVDIDAKTYKDYQPCKFCGGLHGWAKIFHKRPYRREKEKGLEAFWNEELACVFIKSNVGFWKIYWRPSDKMFLLFHLNVFEKEKPVKHLMYGNYHRQKDLQPTGHFDTVINYIASHDSVKEIAQTDYRKLPKKTQKQKRYYKFYKYKAKKESDKRLDQLFEEIKARK